MAQPKYAERVVGLETEWRVFRLETFPQFQDELKREFAELGERVDAASTNGQTPRLKVIGQVLGDPADVQIIKNMVESHKRNAWLFQPFSRLSGQFLSALIWGGGALALAWANTQLHAAFPSIP